MNNVKTKAERPGLKTRAMNWIARAAIVVVTFGVIATSADAAVGKIGKLQKKLNKTEASITAKEALVDAAELQLPLEEANLVQAQLDLVAAQGLPQTTKAEKKVAKKATKAANKAAKRAVKRISKLTQKVAKLQNQIANKIALVAAIELKLDELTIGGLPLPGALGTPGLELPEQVAMFTASIEDDEDDGQPEVMKKGGALPAEFGLPSDSDFHTDETHTFVYDPSMESLDSVNNILCLIRQTAFEALVNEGAYVAQIDPNLCNAGGSADGQEGDVQAVELWTVNSVRKDEEAQHVIGVWVPQMDDDGPAATIHARMVILEEPSEENPFGVFSLDFEGLADGDASGDPLFWGTIESSNALSGFTGFSFYEQNGVEGTSNFSERAVHVNIDANGAGVARVVENGDEAQSYLLAFDDDNVLRQEGVATPDCLSRNTFETSVWNYNLYEAEGVNVGGAVQHNGGFGIATEDGNYGWIGYNGLWLSEDSQVVTGDNVVKNTFDAGDNPETYTVLNAPGRLLRYTQNKLALSSIDGAQFEYWEISDTTPGSGQGTPPASSFGPNLDLPTTKYIVEYDHNSGEFRKIGSFNGDESVTLLNPALAIDVETLGYLDMWSAGLGGSVAYVYGDVDVTFFGEEIVSGNDPVFGQDGSLDLFGFVDALSSGINSQQAELGTVFLNNSMDVEAPYEFTFEKDDLTLYHDVNGNGVMLNVVGLANGVTYDSGPFADGMRSGPMVTDTGDLSNVFDAWNQPSFYVYETGPNDWNKFSTLIDSQGDYLDFEPPVQFTYTHSTANDKNGSSEHDGQTFQLQFYGQGELQGIPHEAVDLNGDGEFDRWYPIFDIADGTVIGPQGNEFLVRGIEMEQRLAADNGACTGLNPNDALILTTPDGSSFEQPNIGDKPVVTGPPAVIAGEVQGDD